MGEDLKGIWKIIVAISLISVLAFCIVKPIVSKISGQQKAIESVNFSSGINGQ